MRSTPKVAIVMGSDSDLPIVQKAIEMLETFGVEREVRVISAHRTPKMLDDFVLKIAEKEIEVVIAAAGKAAHLPGVLAAKTLIPVIGLPMKSSTLDGLDSLLSIVQMPKGMPVATVAINGSENAALLAIQILALKYPYLAEKLASYRDAMAREVHEKDEIVRKNFM
ncbi:MAG: 5-(carboxyamino)imidazole ribonucleotide mutase [Kosmotoga sp.]|uniref:5-(carboxyamino)imidazole ribonucleotide mutase n=1 Tax=Kosmotoga sp. TaxID=1955248 RepID=UPI0025BBA85E|nr:5-(carboxyamino)imidazole ribonucleotide mutase [Kosmotoga sp.]MCD6159716.1 5-(carboxyamino)imidazole ribonucleotide mutase [Kosmotoga sp.]